MNLVILLRFR